MTKIETLVASRGHILKHRYENGFSIRKIADEVGCERKMVSRALGKMGVLMRSLRWRGGYLFWLREHRDEIMALYRNGMSTTEVGRIYHVAPHTIAAVLREGGIPLRRPGGVRLYSHDTIIGGALTGQSQTKLAAQLGVTRSWLSRLETAAGVPARQSKYFEPWRQRMLAERGQEAA